MSFPAPSRWSDVRERLLPVLRSVTTPDHALRLAGSDPERALVRRPFAPLLHGLLVVDLPEMRLYVTRAHLARWGVTADAAFGAALGNLDATAGLALGEQGVWELAAGDGYESSRLLLPGWLATFDKRVPGVPIATVPHARALSVGGSEDAQHIRQFLTVAPRSWHAEGDPVSPVPYTIDARGRVVPWEPGPAAPPVVRASVRAAARGFAVREYARLELRLAETEAPTMQSYEVGLAPASDGDLRQAYGFCRWNRGSAEVLLPESDVVVLEEPGAGAVLAVPFPALRRHVKLERWGEVEPPVWSARQWPDREQSKALRAEALSPDQLG